jgi:hypothetical protein
MKYYKVILLLLGIQFISCKEEQSLLLDASKFETQIGEKKTALYILKNKNGMQV